MNAYWSEYYFEQCDKNVVLTETYSSGLVSAYVSSDMCHTAVSMCGHGMSVTAE